MNYVKELSLFYHRLDRENIPANAILLWYTLMSIANNMYWKSDMSITISQLENKSRLSKATICRMRQKLIDRGFIEYRSMGGRSCGVYRLLSLESQLVSHSDTISETISETIHKHKTINNIENIKRVDEVAALTSTTANNSTHVRKEKSSGKKEKKANPHLDIDSWLEGLDPPWRELMYTWLEYKQSRGERYKSIMSVDKCLACLKKHSNGDPQIAELIVDQSIASNWAGLFELKRQSYPKNASPPVRGQHIGQIMQPENSEKRNRIVENFGKHK